MLAGVLVGAYVGHKRGIPLGAGPQRRRPGAAAGPGDRALGQLLQPGAVRPADRPAVGARDRRRAPPAAGYPPGTTFHPTFLYESLWNFGLCGLLLWIDKRYRPAGGRLLAMYVLGYGVGRFWVEGLRIDEADEIGGLRWNQWVSIALIVGGGLYLLATIHKPKDPVLAPIVHGAPAVGGRRGARRGRSGRRGRRRGARRGRRGRRGESRSVERGRARSTDRRDVEDVDDDEPTVEADSPTTTSPRSELVDHAELERFLRRRRGPGVELLLDTLGR